MKKPQEEYKQKTCPVCGKVFFCYTDTWVYHRTPFGKSKLYICSWKCLNNFDKARKANWKRRGRKPKENE